LGQDVALPAPVEIKHELSEIHRVSVADQVAHSPAAILDESDSGNGPQEVHGRIARCIQKYRPDATRYFISEGLLKRSAHRGV